MNGDVSRVTASVRYIAQAFNQLTQGLGTLLTQLELRPITTNQTIDDTFNGATLVDTTGVTITFPTAASVSSTIFNILIKNQAGGPTSSLVIPVLGTIVLNNTKFAWVKRMGSSWVIFGP